MLDSNVMEGISKGVFFDKDLNQIAVSNVSATSTTSQPYTIEELEDLDDTYIDNTGWNRFND